MKTEKNISTKKTLDINFTYKAAVLVLVMLFTLSSVGAVHIRFTSESSRNIAWAVTINFEETSGNNDYVIFGEAPDASDGQDLYDTPKPCFPPVLFIYAYFDTGLNAPYNRLWHDYRHYGDDYKVWNLYVMYSTTSPIRSDTNITISWNTDEVNNSGYTTILLCNSSGVPLADMSLTDNYMVSCSGEGELNFKILCGTFYLNLVDFPMYAAETIQGYDVDQMCGAAAAQMILNYIHWNSSNDPEPPEPPIYDQDYLYDYAHNRNSNTSLPYIDNKGMQRALISLASPWPYCFVEEHDPNYNEMLKSICVWINFSVVGNENMPNEGHPEHVPAAVPAYGNYSNWMIVRGIHTDRCAWPEPEELTVYGLWVNDPLPGGGVGEKSYKTVDEWLTTYYKPLSVPDDPYNGEYVAVVEPPADYDSSKLDDIELKTAPSPARLTLQETKLIEYIRAKDTTASVALIDMADTVIIQAATEAAKDLCSIDNEFAEAFEQSSHGKPLFVRNLAYGNDYYIVPFNIQMKYTRLHTHKAMNTEEKTVVVVLIDAYDGSLKEASWVNTPVKYLPISNADAQNMVLDVLDKMGIEQENINDMTVELVKRKQAPYYPDWKITVEEHRLEFFISQDGSISY